MCDLFSTKPHLSFPLLSSAVVDELKNILPEENVDLRNPVDPGATGLLKMDRLIKTVGKDANIDTLILLVGVDYLSNIETEENRLLAAEMVTDTVANLMKKIGKPIYILLRQERQNHEDCDRHRRLMISKFIEKDIPWIDGPFNNAAEIFSKIAGYHKHLEILKQRKAS